MATLLEKMESPAGVAIPREKSDVEQRGSTGIFSSPFPFGDAGVVDPGIPSPGVSHAQPEFPDPRGTALKCVSAVGSHILGLPIRFILQSNPIG